MTTDGIIINLDERKKLSGNAARSVAGGPPSEDAVALAFVRLHGSHYRYVPAWRRWIGWNGKRWAIDHDGAVFALIRSIVREASAALGMNGVSPPPTPLLGSSAWRAMTRPSSFSRMRWMPIPGS